MDPRVEKLASELYNKGLSSSLMEAKQKAKDILGLSDDVIKRHTEVANEPRESFYQDPVLTDDTVQETNQELAQESAQETTQEVAQESVQETTQVVNQVATQENTPTAGWPEDEPTDEPEDEPTPSPFTFSELGKEEVREPLNEDASSDEGESLSVTESPELSDSVDVVEEVPDSDEDISYETYDDERTDEP